MRVEGLKGRTLFSGLTVSIRGIIKKTQLLLDQALYESHRALRASDASTQRALDITHLEQRILMSVSPVAVVADSSAPISGNAGLNDQQFLDVVSDTVLPQATQVSESNSNENSVQASGENSEQALELVFIDSGVGNVDQMIADLQSENDADSNRRLEVVVLDSQKDGVAQITLALLQYNDIDGIHIVSHGSDGSVRLGSTTLSLETLDTYRSAISAWQHSLSSEADLLFYGCDLAASNNGREFLNQVSEACRCDVAASEDLTGNAARNGDWDLEYSVGSLNTEVAFSSEFQASWWGTLGEVTVTTTADVVDIDADLSSVSALQANAGSDGFVSLREAIIAANADSQDDTIFLGANAYALSIAGTDENLAATGDLDITSNITLLGQGAANTRIDGAGLDRIFDVRSGTFIVEDVTIVNGDLGGTGSGAGIQVAAGATLRGDRLDIHSNTALDGGGIQNDGDLQLQNSLIRQNTVSRRGAGIRNLGTMTLTNVTVSANMAASRSAGVSNGGTPATLTNVTIANNVGYGLALDVGVTLQNTIISGNTTDVIGYAVTSLGGNIIGDGTGAGFGVNDQQGVDPLLGPLADNGGPVMTHSLDPSSPAINFGQVPGAPTTDGRGYITDGMPDAGSFQLMPTLIVENTSDIVNGSVGSVAALNANDGGDGISLREAILAANADTGTLNLIQFNIAGLGVHTITLTTALPGISDDIIIDGTTQSDFAGTPLIAINATSSGSNGLYLNTGSGGSTIRGLQIWNAPGDGIRIDTDNNLIVGNYIGTDGTNDLGAAFDGIRINGVNNQIGGHSTVDRNLISGNNDDGIEIQAGVTGTIIVGNHIGVTADGTGKIANTDAGVEIAAFAATNRIGGPATAERNVISGNGFGITIFGDSTSVVGNYIGTDATGQNDLGNQFDGIAVHNGADDTLIGGPTAAHGNIISGNDNDGIWINDTSNVTVLGNSIGVGSDGAALGNFHYGIRIDGASSANTIGGSVAGAGNVIANNAWDGVSISGTTSGQVIRGNSIFDNGGLGINIEGGLEDGNGVSANSADTAAPSGTANPQNYPVLTAATYGAGQVNVSGTLSSAANTNYRIDFYASDTTDPSGFGEGQTYLGSQDVTTDGSGAATVGGVFSATLAVGNVTTATATLLDGGDGDVETSEFSQSRTVAAAPSSSLTVDTLNDINDGDTSSVAALLSSRGSDGFISLREALIATNNSGGGITISLGAGRHELTVIGETDETGDFDILADVTILGAGSDLTTIDGNDIHRIFDVRTGDANIQGLKLIDGRATSGPGSGISVAFGTAVVLDDVIIESSYISSDSGGGIFNAGTLTITDSWLKDNTANSASGGGLRNEGTADLTRVLLTGNVANGGSGGAIQNVAGGVLTLTNATVSGNSAPSGSGGGVQTEGTITIINSTIANNSEHGLHVTGGTTSLQNSIFANNGSLDVSGTITSLGNNIVANTTGSLGFGGGDQQNVDPLLSVLADNGGSFQTHALQHGSPAIDGGNNSGAPLDDQRGFNRDGAAVDIGAYEQTAADTADAVTFKIPIAQRIDEDLRLTFSLANGNEIILSGVTSGVPTISATLSVTNGVLTLNNTAGISFLNGTGDGQATLSIAGTEAALNAALNGLHYDPTTNFSAADTLTVTTGTAPATSAGLFASYDFEVDNTSDSSGNGNNALNSGDPQRISDVERGRVLNFDGDDKLTLAGGTATLGGEVTIAAWVNLDAGQGDNVVLSLGDRFSIELDNNSSGWGVGASAFGGGTFTTGVGEIDVAGDGWHHVAATFSDAGDELRVYIDGNLRRTMVIATAADLAGAPSQDITIGGLAAGPNANQNQMVGSLDDVRIYNSVLSSAEIATMMGDHGFDSATVAIAVDPVNDAPTLTAFAAVVQSTSEDTEVEATFADLMAQGNEADVDGTIVAFVVKSVPAGTLRIGGSSGTATAFATNSNDTIDGTNNAYWTPAINSHGTFSALTVVGVDDGGLESVGSIAAQIGVSAQNDAAAIMLPGVQSVSIDSTLTLSSGNGNLISISDVDVAAGEFEVKLSAPNGTLSLATMSGLNFTTGTGAGDPTMVFTGTQAAVNTALNGLQFNPTASFSGATTILVQVDDQNNFGGGGPQVTIRSVAVSVGATESLWFSGHHAVSNAATSGLNNWDTGDVIRLSDPNLAFAPGTSDGTFSGAIDFNSFGSKVDVAALHYVSNDITIGTGTTFDLQTGDVLFAIGEDETLTSTNSLSVAKEDVAVFRPDAVGDYSSGQFYLLLEDVLGKEIQAISLVEETTILPDTTLTAGTLLLVDDNTWNDVYSFTATNTGVGSSGTTTKLLDGSDIGIGAGIYGLELIESDTTIAGIALMSGDLLVIVESSDTVGGNSLGVSEHDVFAISIASTSAGSGATSANARLILEGADLNLKNHNEHFNALTLVVTNLAPTATTTVGTAGYIENDPGVVIDSGISLSDDSTVMSGATISITGGLAAAEDELQFTSQNGISGTYITGTGVLTLTGSSSLANYETALQSVRYRNQSDTPSEATRTISFVVNDGRLSSTAVHRAVSVAALNDAATGLPVIWGSVTEDQILSVDTSGLTDAEGINASSFTYQWLRNGNPINGETNITHTLGDADVGALISVEVRFVDHDGNVEGPLTSIQTTSVTNISDAPILDTAGDLTLTSITEDDFNNDGNTIAEIIVSDGGDRISDVDGPGEGIAVSGTVSSDGSWEYSLNNGATWSDVGSVTSSSALLLRDTDRLRFVPGSDDADSGSVIFFAWDQSAGTAGTTGNPQGGTSEFSFLADTAFISVTATNDPPTIGSLAGDSLNYAEGSGAQLLDQGSDATITDIDSTDFAGGSLNIAFVAGSDGAEDVLGVRNQGTGVGQIGVSGGSITYNDGSGAAVIGRFAGGSGGTPLSIAFTSTTATPTAASAVLRNVTYLNTDTTNATAGVRVVRVVVQDGDGDTSGHYESVVYLGTPTASVTFQNGVNGYTDSEDTFLEETSPGTSFGNNTKVNVDINEGGGNDTTAHGLIRFGSIFGPGTGQIPVGSTVLSASLTVQVVNDSGGSEIVSLNRMLENWSEASTWDELGNGVQLNNIEALALADGTVPDPNVTGQQTVTGLESTLQLWSDGTTNNGWVFTISDDNGWDFLSSESGTVALRPSLSVQYLSNAAPQIINLAGDSLNYDEGDGAVILDQATAASIVDDSANFGAGSMSVAFTSGGTANDRIGILNEGTNPGEIGGTGSSITYNSGSGATVIATFLGGFGGSTPLTVFFNTNATPTVVQALLQNITFENVSENPGESSRIVRFVVTDGDGGTSTAQSLTVNVNRQNDAATGLPTITGTVTEDQVLTADTSGISDGDGITPETFTYQWLRDGVAVVGETMNTYTLGDLDVDARIGVHVSYRDDGGTTEGPLMSLQTTPVLNVNDSPSVDKNTGMTVSEGDTGVVITRAMLETTDVDNAPNELSYTLTGTPTFGSLRLNGTALSNGSHFFQSEINAGRLSYDHDGTENFADSFAIDIDDGSGTVSSETFSIDVTPQNDNAPVITTDGGNATAAFMRNENTTAVTTVAATDADLPTQTLTYALVGGADQTRFSIGSNSGILTFTAAPDFEASTDANADNVYEVVVEVSDGQGLTTLQMISVTVTDVDEFDITSISDTNAAANDVDENAAAGMKIGITALAVDGDGSDNVVYDLQHDADGRFAIDSNTGVVTVAGALDRESAASHSITVRATSADTSATTQSYTVLVNDVNEFDVTLLADTNTAANQLAESEAIGLTVGITAFSQDADATTGTITYTLDDNAGDLFTIDSATGVVTTVAAIDYELTGMSQAIVTRATSADGSTITQAYAIAVLDVDEFDVTPIIDNEAAINQINENAAAGTVVGVTTFSQDADGSTNTITYTLDDDAGGRFAIDAVTGVVTTTGAINFETVGATLNITTRATSADNSTATRNFAITVNDQNDNAPVVTSQQTFLTSEFATAGTSVGLISATDVDTVGTLSGWSIVSGNTDDIFAIDDNTGELIVSDTTNLNFESVSVYSLLLTVADGMNTSAPQNITIAIVDQNDAPVLTTIGPFNVNENSVNGTTVGLASASDEDIGDSLTYTLLNNTGSAFGIDSANGQITVADASLLDFEVATSHILTVNVEDPGGLSDTQTITVRINDVNEAPVDIRLTGGTVDENSAVGTPVASVAGTDVDAGDSLTFQLIESANGRFAVDLNSGLITVASDGLLNFEDAPSHTVTVQSTDSGGLSRDESFVITVNDVNEAPEARDDEFEGRQMEALEVAAGLITANDFDVDGNAISVQLVTPPSHGTLSLNTDGAFLYSPDNVFSGLDQFQYLVTDGSLASDPVTVTLNMRITVSGVTTDDTDDHLDDSENLNSYGAIQTAMADGRKYSTEEDSENDRGVDVIDPLNSIGTNKHAKNNDADSETDTNAAATTSALESIRNAATDAAVNVFLDEVPELDVTQEAARRTRREAETTTGTSQQKRASAFLFSQITTSTPLFVTSDFQLDPTQVAQDAEQRRQNEFVFDKIVIGSAATVSTSLSVGYAVWLLKGGSLLTTFLSSLPAWQSFDPLPVLESAAEESDDDGETLSSIAAGN